MKKFFVTLILILIIIVNVQAEKVNAIINNHTSVIFTDMSTISGDAGDTFNFIKYETDDTTAQRIFDNDNKFFIVWLNGDRTDETIIIDENTKQRTVIYNNAVKIIKSVDIRTIVNGILQSQICFAEIK